ncbi:uncharacterized protein TNCV_1934471 [Trichonephila clavipes]|nr:uncharacterized protein TNCV_1934471 [Trichonephila clavipes]
MLNMTNQYLVYPPVTAIETKIRHGIESVRPPTVSVEDCVSLFATGQLFYQYSGTTTVAFQTHHLPTLLAKDLLSCGWLKDVWNLCAHDVCCPRHSPIDASVWSGAAYKEPGLQRHGTRSSLATNPDSISAVMTIVFVCGDPVVNASNLPLLYSDTPLPQLMVDVSFDDIDEAVLCGKK